MDGGARKEMLLLQKLPLGRIIAALWSCLFLLLPVATLAQDGDRPTSAELRSPAAVDAMVSRLTDQEVRDLLLSELGARATAAQSAAPPAGSVDGLSQQLSAIAAELVTAVQESPLHAKAAVVACHDYLAGLGGRGSAWLATALLIALIFGHLADWALASKVVPEVTLPALPGVGAVAVPSAVAALVAPLRHLSHEIIGAVVALAVSAAVAAFLLPPRETRVVLTVLVWLVCVPRLGLEMARVLNRSQPLGSRSARLFPTGIFLAAVLAGIAETLWRIAVETGREVQTQGAGFWVNTVVFLLLAAMVWSSRPVLRDTMGNGTAGNGMAGQPRTLFERAYPALALIAILWTWLASTVAMAAGAPQGMQTGRHLIGLCLLLATPMFDGLIRTGVLAALRGAQGSGALADAAKEAVYSSGVRVARVVFFGAVVLVTAWLWEISVYRVASAGIGEVLAQRSVMALLILLSGYVLWELIRLLINRRLLTETGFAPGPLSPEEVDDGYQPSAASRLATILPPLGFVAQVAVLVITVLMTLDVMGVNVTPLMAGAGVAGIALGFGAQKLVADVVSGVFFLIEDAFRANEYVKTGGIEGTVESLSIRSLHLRQSDGALNCIPYSNVSAITNMSRDWGTMKQVFTVPFDTDIEKVRKIFKRIGQDLMANPAFAPAFILPFKFKGVSQVNDVGIVVRGKFMFRPELSQQFLIQREIYRRVQLDFAAAGIAFARREVRVAVSDGVPLSSTLVLGGAAALAAPDSDPATPNLSI